MTLAGADQLVVSMARLMRPQGVAGGATPCAMLAAWLAVALHGQESALSAMTSPGSLGGLPVLTLSRQEWAARAAGSAFVRFERLFDFVWRGSFQIWIRPAQLDPWGNSNISAVGAWRRPRAAIIGCRGLPDDSVALHETCYYVPRHSPRVFVPSVDVVDGVGHGPRRQQAGTGAGAPAHVVTDLAVFDFAPDGRLRLAALQPGVTIDRVRAATGFPLSLPDAGEVGSVPPPTEEELAWLARLDPLGLRELEFLSGDEAREKLAGAYAAEAMLDVSGEIRQIGEMR